MIELIRPVNHGFENLSELMITICEMKTHKPHKRITFIMVHVAPYRHSQQSPDNPGNRIQCKKADYFFEIRRHFTGVRFHSTTCPSACRHRLISSRPRHPPRHPRLGRGSVQATQRHENSVFRGVSRQWSYQIGMCPTSSLADPGLKPG